MLASSPVICCREADTFDRIGTHHGWMNWGWQVAKVYTQAGERCIHQTLKKMCVCVCVCVCVSRLIQLGYLPPYTLHSSPKSRCHLAHLIASHLIVAIATIPQVSDFWDRCTNLWSKKEKEMYCWSIPVSSSSATGSRGKHIMESINQRAERYFLEQIQQPSHGSQQVPEPS